MAGTVPEGTVYILGLPIPLTEDDAKDDPRHVHMKRCAKELAEITKNNQPETGGVAAEIESRLCVAATLHYGCLEHRFGKAVSERHRLGKEEFNAAAPKIDALGRARSDAYNLQKRLCPEDMMLRGPDKFDLSEWRNEWAAKHGEESSL